MSKNERAKKMRLEAGRKRQARKREAEKHDRNAAERQMKLDVMATWPKDKPAEFDEQAKRGNAIGLELLREAEREGNVEASGRHLQMIRLLYFDKLLEAGTLTLPTAAKHPELQPAD